VVRIDEVIARQLCGKLVSAATDPDSTVEDGMFSMRSVPGLHNESQLEVIRTIGKFPRSTPIRELHMAFQVQYIYDYITKLCRQQAEVIQNHENASDRDIGTGEARHRKYEYKRLKLGAGQACNSSSD
jgi:hypothetical protein